METRSTCVVAGVALALALVSTNTAAQSAFRLRCHPFKSLERKHPVDTSCRAARGKSQAGTGQAAQNSAKNNFCATGPVVDLTHQQFLDLQRVAETLPDYASWNGNHLPSDRDLFTSLPGQFQEGMLVRYTGFVYELHAADTGSGESVNCKATGAEANDIHIAFVARLTDDECSSITAEMSPHFRPTEWRASKMARWVAANRKTKAGLVANPQGKRLSRITGQLMFDAAHKPCRNGKRNPGDPARASLFEVHPIYEMEVCKTIGPTCADSDWQPLDEFLKAVAP